MDRMRLTANGLTLICTFAVPLAIMITIFARYFAVDLWKGLRLDKQMQYHLLMTPAANWWEQTMRPKTLAAHYLAHGGDSEICKEFLWRKRHYPFAEWFTLWTPFSPFVISSIFGKSVHTFWTNLGF